MIGNIIGIEENTVLINLSIDLNKIQNLIGLMVIMEDNDKKIVGEIANIKNNIGYINLLGEIRNNKGIIKAVIQYSKPELLYISHLAIKNILNTNNIQFIILLYI